MSHLTFQFLFYNSLNRPLHFLLMSFWNSYAKPHTDKRFQAIQSRTLSPTTLSILVAKQEHVPELTTFLTTYFGGANHPTLRPVLNPSKNELILFTRTEQADIQATIRYKYAGQFENQPIYLIDCFCSKERRTGIASQLLIALHARTEHVPYALFLKEGLPVPGQEPLYSSHYVFRRTKPPLSPLCHSLSPRQAFALVEAYRGVYKDMFWLGSESNPNQSWRLWKRGALWALACFQDSFQETGENERIGWMTAYIGNCDEGLECVVDSSPYPLIWADRVWIRDLTKWMVDGPFHWYSYRWTTGLLPATGATGGCYGIIV